MLQPTLFIGFYTNSTGGSVCSYYVNRICIEDEHL